MAKNSHALGRKKAGLAADRFELTALDSSVSAKRCILSLIASISSGGIMNAYGPTCIDSILRQFTICSLVNFITFRLSNL
jgi:hypothetical protein